MQTAVAGPGSCLAFQLFLELVEDAPVGALRNDLLWTRFDHPGLVETEGVEADRIIRVVLSLMLIYSITSSARISRDCGIVIPRALAVLRLMTSSNFVGCSTGRSAGLAPLRMRSTYPAAFRASSLRPGV